MPTTIPAPIRTTNLSPRSGKSYRLGEDGLVITSVYRDPVWQGEFVTPPLDAEDRGELLAWLDDCVDRNLRVDYVHPLYKYPAGYKESTWPLVSDPTLSAVVNQRQITVAGLSDTLTLPKGTRLSIIQGNRVCYRRLAAAVAAPSSISETIEITPRIPLGVFAPSALVRFERPFVRMMVIPDSWDSTEDIEATPVAFSMVESLT